MSKTIEVFPNYSLSLKRIVTSQLQHLCSYIISPSQHRFVKRRSPTTNILRLTSLIIDGFKKRIQTNVIFTNFSKAFDSVNHSLLLQKLCLVGFPVNHLNFPENSRNRTQKVFSDIRFLNVFRWPLMSSKVVTWSNPCINNLPSIMSHPKELLYADRVMPCI